MKTCPICELGVLSEEVDVVKVSKCAEALSYYSICSHCGSEQANAEQMRRNKQSIEKARRYKCIN